MADIGINFRATAGYVTDGASETYCAGDLYPTTRGGVTFGWNVGIGGSRDRNSALDRRLAGINFDNTVGRNFRIDLPSSGSWDVHIAAGDATTNNGGLWDLVDNTTVFQSLTGDSLGGGNFRDASNVTRSSAAWPGSETLINRAFGSSIFKLTIGAGSVANNVIAHVRLVSAGTTVIYDYGGPVDIPHQFVGPMALRRKSQRTQPGDVNLSFSTYSIIASGGLAIGGSSTFFLAENPIPGGGVFLGGTATAAEQNNPSTSGGAVLGGAATVFETANPSVAGGAVLGGSSTPLETANPSVSGGAVLGGTGTLFATMNPSSSGGVVIGGTAGLDTPGNITGSGGGVLGGSGVVFTTNNPQVSGGSAVSGTGTVSETMQPSPSGGLNIGGASIATETSVVIASGGINLTGSFTVTISGSTVGTSGPMHVAADLCYEHQAQAWLLYEHPVVTYAIYEHNSEAGDTYQ